MKYKTTLFIINSRYWRFRAMIHLQEFLDAKRISYQVIQDNEVMKKIACGSTIVVIRGVKPNDRGIVADKVYVHYYNMTAADYDKTIDIIHGLRSNVYWVILKNYDSFLSSIVAGGGVL